MLSAAKSLQLASNIKKLRKKGDGALEKKLLKQFQKKGERKIGPGNSRASDYHLRERIRSQRRYKRPPRARGIHKIIA